MTIPVANPNNDISIIPISKPDKGNNEYVLFSFAAIERTEYFNLDGTCQNWASDLFQTLQVVSNIKMSEIRAGKFSGKHSTLRIHDHKGIKKACSSPSNVSLDDMWQIRISTSKGGIHGVFYENIFYVIWFDPQHNLYPDSNHGGLKKIVPPSTCCKDRDAEIADWKAKYEQLQNDYEAATVLLEEYSS